MEPPRRQQASTTRWRGTPPIRLAVAQTARVSEWVAAIFAGLAVVVSAFTWYEQRRYQAAAERRANVSVRFHWLTEHAKVVLPGREPLRAGYHLVLANRGPAAARQVGIDVRDSSGHTLTLLDVGDGEFPLNVLDADCQYPIPWLYEPFTRHARRFSATVRWTDGDGHHERTVPLRRGQVLQ